jgi:hypothetical protein
MPYGYKYPGMKEITARVKQGDLNDVPDGNLFRMPLEKKLLAEPDQNQFADHSNSKPANRHVDGSIDRLHGDFSLQKDFS